MRKALAGIGGFLLLLVVMWHVAVPESALSSLLNRALSDTGYSVEMGGVRKGLFCSFKAETLSLLARSGADQSRGGGITLQDVSAGLSPGSLITLTPRLDLRGLLGRGRLSAATRLTGDRSSSVSVASVSLRDSPVLSSYGIEGDGLLEGELHVTGGLGRLTFSVKDARLENTAPGGVTLPLSLFHTVRGILDFMPEKTEIPSVSLEGAGIYARVSGAIQGRMMKLNVEVMHDASYAPDPLTAAMLRPYRVSPGYYVIPITQTAP